VAGQITVEVASQADPGLLEAANRLVEQLSSSPVPMSAAELDEIVSSPCSVLLVARDRGRAGGNGGVVDGGGSEGVEDVGGGGGGGGVVGMLTLVVFRIPTGVRAWIEDVVVDSSARGSGIGSALVNEALAVAAARGARTVDLTSRPSRQEANRLYRQLGFVERQTNVYRHQAPPA